MPPTLLLEPQSDWVLDYDDDSCALRRAFGDGDIGAFLELRQFAPDDTIQFTAYSTDIGITPHPAIYRADPDEAATASSVTYYVNFGEGGTGVQFQGDLRRSAERPQQPDTGWDPDQRAGREREIDGISVYSGLDRPVTFATGSLGSPMQAMRVCLDELLTHWNIDVAAHRTLNRRATPWRMERWIGQVRRVYPTRMLRDGEQAKLRVRLMVNEEGRASECFVQSTIGDKGFEDEACEQLLDHARFEPALDAQNRPIRSFWTTSMIYTLAHGGRR